MFEFNGQLITLEQINAKAQAQGVDVDKYIEFLKTKGLKEDIGALRPMTEEEKKVFEPDFQPGASLKENWKNFTTTLSNATEMVGDVKEFWSGAFYDAEDIERAVDEKDLGAYSGATIASTILFEKIFGRETLKNWKENNDNFLKELVTYDYIASDSETFAKIIGDFEEEQKQQKKTMTFAEAEDFSDYLSVAGGAVANVGGSVAYNLGTLGTGFFMEFAADNFITANEAKANAQEISLEKLLQNGEGDIDAPIKIAALQAGLEFAGFKGIMKPLKGTKISKTYNKALGKYLTDTYKKSKAIRIGLDLVSTGSKEALTEMGQTGLEIYNKELAEAKAQGNEINDFTSIVKGMFSPEGIEAGLQGFFGGSGLRAGGYSAKALNSVRKTEQTLDVEKELNDLTKLNSSYNKTSDRDWETYL